MDKTLGWLHLSDLHVLDKHDWRDGPVLKKLPDDVARLKTNGLCIDLVLCTGDIGYGEASTDPLTAQYATAKVYFDKVVHACGLTNDRLFLVPGNHDIDRIKALDSQTEYFRAVERNPRDINQMFRDRHGEVQRAMERLDQYRQFLKDNYPHIPLNDNATFGAWLTINEVKISIAGLNSAWTCADNNDKGKLWLAGEAQLHTCWKAIETSSAGSATDIRIALVHHPLAWLNPAEAKQLRGRIQDECDFLLHGHEHDQWVQPNDNPYHIVIASGAATADTEGEFGYNLVQLGPGKANIHLRSYHKKGSGWGKEIIPGHADDGIWPITPPPIFSSPDQPAPVEAPLGVPGPFSTSLPTIGRSEYEVHEKFTLFGGRPINLGFTAIKYAVATHSFDRDLVATLCQTIRAPGARIRSFTISSLPGAGLSLALAQLVRDLFLDADIKLFWVIDDPDNTCRVLSRLSKDEADSFYSGISAYSPRVEHAVIILDDVSKAPSHTRNLIDFRERCKNLANERLGPRVTFIFGSFGDTRTCSEDDTFKLELTENDRERCYKQMTSVEPQILFGVEGGLGAILRNYPEARWYQNDAQAFIDFLLQHGQPTLEANKHWLARTDGLDGTGLAIFKTTAVAQLIGLHIEEAVVKRLFSSLAREPLQDVEQVVHQVRGLALIQQEWKGLGLSCARRARSILERTNTFKLDFLCETFSEFVRESLEHFQADGHGAHRTLEFARHIFQRLSKEPLYRFNDDKRIAQDLCRIHLDGLIAASDHWNDFEKARWAGTLSAVVAPVQGAEPMDDTSLSKAICLICGLCEDAFSKVSGHAKSLLPDAALSLYRASSRLLLSPPTPHTSRIQKFCFGLQYGINTEEFFNILDQVLVSDVNDPSFRANELVHARSKFEDSFKGKKDRQYCKSMYNWYAQVEQFFNENHIELDAGSWLKRADYVWIDGHASARHREPSVTARANCLKQARNCVQHYPYSQGTWGKAVAKAVMSFLRENPALAPEFRAIQP